jgi:organic hydroperoxide reductase OsmC/OhrA
VGTFAGALAARGIPLGAGELVGEAVGEVEKTADGVLIIRRIHVTHRLQVDPEHREVVQRAHDVYARLCPVARSIEAAIDVTSEYEFVSRKS